MMRAEPESAEVRACRRKVRMSRAKAIRTVDRVRDVRGVELVHYRCRYCGGYHVARDRS